jgi:hypothetical protein
MARGDRRSTSPTASELHLHTVDHAPAQLAQHVITDLVEELLLRNVITSGPVNQFFQKQPHAK